MLRFMLIQANSCKKSCKKIGEYCILILFQYRHIFIFAYSEIYVKSPSINKQRTNVNIKYKHGIG